MADPKQPTTAAATGPKPTTQPGGRTTVPASSQSTARSVQPGGGAKVGPGPLTNPIPDDAIKGGTIKVRATATGYYGDARRREGDVFTLYPRRGSFTEHVLDKNGDVRLDANNIIVTKEVVKVLSADDQFNPKWMERVDGRTPERTTDAATALAKQHAEQKRAKVAGSEPAPTGDTNVLDE